MAMQSTSGQLDQKLPKITLGPMDQKFIVYIARFIGSLLVQWTRSGLIFMLAFTKSAPEIEVIAPPHLAEAFQIKLNLATQMT